MSQEIVQSTAVFNIATDLLMTANREQAVLALMLAPHRSLRLALELSKGNVK